MALDPHTNATLQEIAKEIVKYDSFVIVGHVSPDGDCLGSQLALSWALRSLGKKTTCLLASKDSLELGLRFLPGLSDMVPAEEFDGEFDAFVSTDVPTFDRMGKSFDVRSRAKVSFCLDHHPSQEAIADFNYIDPDSASCSMIVWQLIAYMNVDFDKNMADCAFTGLMTDTGRFQFQNADKEAFELAAQMVSAGADPSYCAQQVYQSRTYASLMLEKCLLERVVISSNHDWAFAYVTLKEFEDYGAIKADAEPLIDVLRSMDGVRFVCVLREQADVVRGSLRTKDESIDVSTLARYIGGGGHKAAAGFTYKGSLEGCVKELPKLMDDLAAGRF